MRRRRFRPAPRPIDPPCPNWCTRDHALDLDVNRDLVVVHSREMGNGVQVIACDDIQDGTRTPDEVVVEATLCETPEAARRLALAILEASDVLDGAQ